MSDHEPDHRNGADALESLRDPAVLFDSTDVEVEAARESVDSEEFETAEEWDSHVAIGVADDRGVLLYDDGHHGWTLPAFTVANDGDYFAVARREFEALTGIELDVDGVEHARRRVFFLDDSEDSQAETDVWNVVLRATPRGGLADDPVSHVDGTELQWFDDSPDGVEGVVAADIQRIVNRAGSLDIPPSPIDEPSLDTASTDSTE